MTSAPRPNRLERRRFPRRSGRCLVAVLPATGVADVIPNREWAFRATPLRGPMLDISIGGVAFALGEPIEPGRLLDVELRNSQRLVAVVRRVSVVAHQPHGENRWKILCRFLQSLSFDEVSRLSLEPTV